MKNHVIVILVVLAVIAAFLMYFASLQTVVRSSVIVPSVVSAEGGVLLQQHTTQKQGGGDTSSLILPDTQKESLAVEDNVNTSLGGNNDTKLSVIPVFDTLATYFIELLAGLVTITMTAIIASMTQQKGILRARVASLAGTLSALNKPAKVNVDETTNSAMILGIGGAGKTSIIRVMVKFF